MYELRRTQARATGEGAQLALCQRAGNVANLQAQVRSERAQQLLQDAAASQCIELEGSAGSEAFAASIGPLQQRPFQA